MQGVIKDVTKKVIGITKEEGLIGLARAIKRFIVFHPKFSLRWKCLSLLRPLLKFIFIRNGKITNINVFEEKIYSQNGEDGILKIIFERIGTFNKFCVELGVGDGRECNTRYFIEKGWKYLHMDARSFRHAYTDIKKEFITAENINQLFEKYRVPEEFDLLSIDIDYNTYWVWKALEGKYKPRVVVIEYNATFPPTESKVVKYDPNAIWEGDNYFGASLLALVRLGKQKGYTLVGCESNGVNAFFVRDDLVNNFFVVKDIKELYKPPRYGKKVKGKYIGHQPSNELFISV